MANLFLRPSLGFYEKQVLKLNLPNEVNFPKILFSRLSLCFLRQAGFKTKPRQMNNTPKVALKLKHKPRQLNFGNLFFRFC